MSNTMKAVFLDSNPATGVNFFAIISDNPELLAKFQTAQGDYYRVVGSEHPDYTGRPKYSTKFKCTDFEIGFSSSGKIIHLEDETDKLVKLVDTYKGKVADKLADRVADLIMKQHRKPKAQDLEPHVEEQPQTDEGGLDDL